jgi:hypothetical protein
VNTGSAVCAKLVRIMFLQRAMMIKEIDDMRKIWIATLAATMLVCCGTPASASDWYKGEVCWSGGYCATVNNCNTPYSTSPAELYQLHMKGGYPATIGDSDDGGVIVDTGAGYKVFYYNSQDKCEAHREKFERRYEQEQRGLDKYR